MRSRQKRKHSKSSKKKGRNFNIKTTKTVFLYAFYLAFSFLSPKLNTILYTIFNIFLKSIVKIEAISAPLAFFLTTPILFVLEIKFSQYLDKKVLTKQRFTKKFFSNYDIAEIFLFYSFGMLFIIFNFNNEIGYVFLGQYYLYIIHFYTSLITGKDKG